MNAIIFHPLFMLILGILTHFAFELGEITARSGVVANPLDYVKQRPYRTFLSIVGALLGYALLLDTIPPQTISEYRMAAMTFGVGFLADSSIKSVSNMARGAITRGSASTPDNEEGDTNGNDDRYD